MPELPEVQTVVSDLNKKIKGDTITGFWSDWPSAIKNATLEKFKKEIKNRKILGVRRIGKNIFVDLSGGKTLYLHLKMTGHLIIKSESQSADDKKHFADRVNQYIHHSWELKGKKGEKKRLDFSDLRKFAKILWLDTDQVMELKEIKALGIDAIDPKFDAPYFQALLDQRPKRKIRDILMDQTLIAGIGNIYLSEILYASGILPTRISGKIKPREAQTIHQNILKILKKAVKMRGTSDSDYRDTSGAPGGFQKVLKVYRRTGTKCPKCATMIQRARMGQRSVFFCSQCQK